jgi:Ulp1 protease family, C-terminal catalytic domain
MRTTKKRKLALEEFSRCNPRLGKSRKRCLPSTTYHEIETVVGKKGKKLFESVGCNNGEEQCLLDKVSINEDTKKTLRKEYLRPRYPKEWEKKPDTWLDNYNIQYVMKQYADAFLWFKFMGVYPIDFSIANPYIKGGAPKCLHIDLCNLKLKDEYIKGKRGIGMVFNLDPHYKGGSHWVALYIDIHNINKPFIGYFDSYGYKTPSMIARFMRAFTLQIPDCQLGFNARRFQYSNTECGMYSMYFLICMIHGISFKEFCKEAIKDSTMLELRKILFSH